MVNETVKEPVEIEGCDSGGIKRKKIPFPKDASADEIYWAMMDMVWKARIEAAIKENKPLEEAMREQLLRQARNRNESIDIEAAMERAMKKYGELLEHKKSVEASSKST